MTSPSSLAASCAPVFAASKKPLPKDFATRAIFTSAKAEPDNARMATVRIKLAFVFIAFTPRELVFVGLAGEDSPRLSERGAMLLWVQI
ncbi:hypothetical protein EMIT091MI3_160056 [Kosakonia quasisacchari]